MRGRFLISFLLVLSLVTTSQAMAGERMVPGPVGAVVLCIGGSTVLVQVDAEGQPVGAPHFCPDCALQAVPLPEQSVPIPQAVAFSAAKEVTVEAPLRPTVSGVLPPCRAPPLFV